MQCAGKTAYSIFTINVLAFFCSYQVRTREFTNSHKLEACALRLILVAVINNDNTKAMAAGIYRAVTMSHVLYYVHIISCHLHSGTMWYRWDSNTLPVCLQSRAAFLHHAGYRKETQSPDMSEDGGPGWFRTEDSDLALWSQRPLWPGPAHVLSADP